MGARKDGNRAVSAFLRSSEPAGTLSLAYACIIVAFLAIKTAREERWLREELEGYVEYERRVRRLIPFVY